MTIAEENLVAADESLDSIQSTVSLLAIQPEMGKAHPELADGLRSFPTRNFLEQSLSKFLSSLSRF